MSELSRIASMLKDAAVEKRIAACIVLAELRAKGPDLLAGYVSLLRSGVPVLERHALFGIARIGTKKTADVVFPFLLSEDAEVRGAAHKAIVSLGDSIVPNVKARLAGATPEERRALDQVLAELGGKEAFGALLSGLASGDAETAKAAAIAVRNEVKGVSPDTRKRYLGEVERFLATQRKGLASSAATSAAIKILGYLEDARATGTLLAYAANTKEETAVRQEAVISLRFALSQGTHPKAVDVLIDLASGNDKLLAQTALHTLGTLVIGAEHAKRLEKLIMHPDLERCRFVIEQLGRQHGADAAKMLARVCATGERRRAEWAAHALGPSEHAAPVLAKAMLETTDMDRLVLLRNTVRPVAKRVPTALRKELLLLALRRLEKGERGFEPLLDLAKDCDPEGTAEALRALAHKLARAKKMDLALGVLSTLCKMDKATDSDRFDRAALSLIRKTHDTRPQARAADDALRQLSLLLSRGFDVAKAVRQGRTLGMDEMYYVGFHFAEEGHPLGAELLSHVVKKGGRTKLAKMAKNKLALTES